MQHAVCKSLTCSLVSRRALAYSGLYDAFRNTLHTAARRPAPLSSLRGALGTIFRPSAPESNPAPYEEVAESAISENHDCVEADCALHEDASARDKAKLDPAPFHEEAPHIPAAWARGLADVADDLERRAAPAPVDLPSVPWPTTDVNTWALLKEHRTALARRGWAARPVVPRGTHRPAPALQKRFDLALMCAKEMRAAAAADFVGALLRRMDALRVRRRLALLRDARC
jgi:hypothetical protein